MNLAENLALEFPQVVEENFTSESKERWATDMKILLQRRVLMLPRERDIVAQFHSIKRRVLPSGKVSFEAERTKNGHADRFWAVALACQKERIAGREPVEIGVRILGVPPRPAPLVLPAAAEETPEPPILVELWSDESESASATAATIAALGGELLRDESGEFVVRNGVHLVRPFARSSDFLRFALARQGYVRCVKPG